MDGNHGINPPASASGTIDIHEPFTKQERFQQLTEIDQDVTAILENTGNAIKALGKTPVPTTSEPNSNASADAEFDPQARLATFKEAMDAVMVMLHSVDTRLKRQIYGLEEAGIITLPTAAQRAEEGAANGSGGAQQNAGGAGGAPGVGPTGADQAVKTSLKPNGTGKVGTLDVGLVNANNSTMEREMERELWVQTRQHLESIAQEQREGDDTVMR